MSLTATERRVIARAREVAALDGPGVRARFSDRDGDAYARAFGLAQWEIGELLAIIGRLAEADEDCTCSTCGALIGIFQDRPGWHHYRGDGTAASPVELYDAGHEASP